MDSYLMMLYVSMEQEAAMMKLFFDNGWKYCKPDLLQLTDKLGGVQASCESSEAIENTKITSLSESTEASIISPGRPGTRSKKSRIRVPAPALKSKTSKRRAISLEEQTEHFVTDDIQAMKEDSREGVDDDDLNEYMEYGDEDDDYNDDDDVKEVKRRKRKLARNSESDQCIVEREEGTAKLDGTEDSDPEDLSIMFHGEENSTDDDGSESNTDNSGNIVPNVSQSTEPTVKVVAATRITGKRKKRPKLDKKTTPLQYQCGLCKVKYSDKKELNKHLTDKACIGDIDNIVSKPGDNDVDIVNMSAEAEQVFDNILLTETDKIDNVPDLMIPEGQMDDLEDFENKVASAVVNVNDETDNKNEKNFYKCDKCDLAYKSAYNLKTHQVMKHGLKLDESFECGICGLSYGSEHILSLHKLDKHGLTGDPAYNVECEECKMMCDDNMSYKLHKKREHNIMVFTELNRKFKCPTCGKAFTRRDSLKNHCEIIHLGTKPRKQKPRPTERKHICDFCGKAFLRRNNLSEHISVKHKDTAKKHKCEDCGETFLRPHALEYHKNKVHLHKKPYECEKCHKTYFSSINLRQHKELCYKEEEEKEACPYCDKRFIHKRNLDMHLEAIHTDSPLTCECGHIIKWRSSIAKHRRKCPLLQPSKAESTIQDVFVKTEFGETINTNTIEKMSGLEMTNVENPIDMGFTTIATDSGEQVISNEIAQALQEQGLLVDGAVAGTLKMEDGKTVVEEDPSVQSVYYVIMKE